jgi:hypothetical protein
MESTYIYIYIYILHCDSFFRSLFLCGFHLSSFTYSLLPSFIHLRHLWHLRHCFTTFTAFTALFAPTGIRSDAYGISFTSSTFDSHPPHSVLFFSSLSFVFVSAACFFLMIPPGAKEDCQLLTLG